MINKIKCYKIHLTFDKKNIHSNMSYILDNNKKAYMCIVDMNVIANTFMSEDYRTIVNKASFNTCDGSVLAFIKNIKNLKINKFKSYNGPEIFKKFIKDKRLNQLIIGPSSEDFNLLKAKLNTSHHLHNINLPFLKVDDFNYQEIANKINILKPKLIWVLLGAPKQEYFISKLYPHINSGLLLGAGAALDFYLGRIHNSSFSILGLRFIWIERVLRDPKKQIKRLLLFFKFLPRIIKSA